MTVTRARLTLWRSAKVASDALASMAVDDLASQGLAARSVRLALDDEASITDAAAAIAAVRRVMGTNFLGTLALTRAMLPLLRAAPTGRIVNLSSSLGSPTLSGDPTSTYYSAQFVGHNASKAALNVLAVQLHEALRDTPIVVRSVGPGFVKTDLTGYGTITPEEGARLPVRYALGGEESGRFVEPAGETPW